jgi:hypothetical protein
VRLQGVGGTAEQEMLIWVPPPMLCAPDAPLMTLSLMVDDAPEYAETAND